MSSFNHRGIAVNVPHRGGGGQTFAQYMAGLADLVAYWPIDDAAGSAILRGLPSAALDGDNTAITLQQDAGALGVCGVWNGGTSYGDINSAALISAFNAAKGTLLLFPAMSGAGVWTDSTFRRLVYLYVNDNNRIFIGRDNVDNRLSFRLIAGGTDREILHDGMGGSTDRFMVALTWSTTAGETRVNINGYQVESVLDGPGTWAGSFSAAYIGAGGAPAQVMDGSICHVALFDAAKSDAELLAIAQRAGVAFDTMTIEVTTTTSPQTVTLTRITPDGENAIVFWGDGTSDTIVDGDTGTTGHSYATAGTYTLTVTLADITWFDAHNAALSGAIPAELGNLANLIVLYLHDNDLDGPIPAELGNLANLQYLYLYGNNLDGPIPAELGNLVNLLYLLLNSNNLDGPIPAELGNLANLQYLYLNINNLDGPIPAELGNLANLQYLRLNINNLDGPESGALQGVKLSSVQVQDNVWSEAEVGAAIDDIWSSRANYTDATPELTISGTNAAPAGNVAAPPGGGASNSDWTWNDPVYEPETAGAKIYDLANDVNTEGFNTWAITYTGGAAP